MGSSSEQGIPLGNGKLQGTTGDSFGEWRAPVNKAFLLEMGSSRGILRIPWQNNNLQGTIGDSLGALGSFRR